MHTHTHNAVCVCVMHRISNFYRCFHQNCLKLIRLWNGRRQRQTKKQRAQQQQLKKIIKTTKRTKKKTKNYPRPGPSTWVIRGLDEWQRRQRRSLCINSIHAMRAERVRGGGVGVRAYQNERNDIDLTHTNKQTASERGRARARWSERKRAN